ncbi:TetR family transcriptional regulator [Staphylococcus massiliensis]|uniref:TetR/AcrR family transcriptional regulator n=1 Tax=Staphylococcus massiliensis TaxID=555791 RepID=UPI001EDED5AA|nr:TetR family transcriptional regulator [Staphylococcus massiliensis]MCG3402253.1 TetR family transcriptional regulator [Staphylococcus massiliensis]
MDRRMIKTQNALKTSLLKLLERDTIEAITVTDICERSNIVRRTFYAHYTDKFELVEHIMDDYINDFIEICKYRESPDFEAGTIRWFKFLNQNKLVFRVFFNSSISSIFLKKFEYNVKKEIFSKLKSEYKDHPILKEKTLLVFLTSAILGVMYDYCTHNNKNYKRKAQEVVILMEPYIE